MKIGLVFSLTFGIAACGGSSEGTAPAAMSEAQHEQSAGAETAASEQHAAQYDPNASEPRTRCAKTVCWSSDVNPTQEHYAALQQHRELAAKHRAAASALRDAEARACAGIDEEDRDISPFFRKEDIVEVTPLQTVEQHGRSAHPMPTGGRATFRAVPGLTAEWLQHLVDCHQARAAAVGYDMPDMDYCPLVLRGVTAKVASAGNGLAIEVTAMDAGTSQEVVRRMQAAKAR